MSNLTIGRGELFFDKYAPGTTTKTGERYLGATPGFTVTAESQKVDHFSSEGPIRVKDASITVQVDYAAAITFEDMSDENVSMFFLGESESATIPAAVGETDTFTAGHGMHYQLGASDAKPEGVELVSNVVVTNTGAVTTYVEGTDYELNADEGFIQVLASGTIPSGGEIIVTYDVALQTQGRVISGQTQIEGAMRFRSRNAAGSQRNIYMPKVTLAPSGEFALKGEDWQNIAFNAEILQAGNLANLFASGRAVAG